MSTQIQRSNDKRCSPLTFKKNSFVLALVERVVTYYVQVQRLRCFMKLYFQNSIEKMPLND